MSAAVVGLDRRSGQSNSVGVESLAFDWANAERRGKTRSHRALRQKGKLGMVEPGEFVVALKLLIPTVTTSQHYVQSI